MSWYIHPSKQLRDDELPPELVVTSCDGSIEQAYVPYNASERLQAENAKLRELVREIWRSCPVSEDDCAKCPHYIEESEEVSCDIPIRMEKLGIEVNA